MWFGGGTWAGIKVVAVGKAWVLLVPLPMHAWTSPAQTCWPESGTGCQQN